MFAIKLPKVFKYQTIIPTNKTTRSNAMKNLYALILSVALAAFAVTNVTAQCSDKAIKKATKDGLGTYIFESAAFKPLSAFNSSKGSVEAAFSVYSQESYRVLNLCQGFSETPEFSVFDSEKNLLFSSAKDKDRKGTYDFVAQKSGDYTIQFKVVGADQKNGNACVAFAIGYK